MARLSQRVGKIHTSPIRRVAGLLDEVRARGNIISFGGGVPSLSPPPGFIQEFNRLMSTEALRSSGYTGTRGIPELRSAIALDVKRYGKVDFDPSLLPGRLSSSSPRSLASPSSLPFPAAFPPAGDYSPREHYHRRGCA